jgi:preprotein translocase subunit SecD
MNAGSVAIVSRTVLFITLVLGGCARTARTSADAESQRVPDQPPLMEFRLVRAVSFPDAVVEVFRGDTIYLEARPILSDPDFRVVQPDLGEGRLIISFEATEEAGRRYRQVTAAHVGERLALLLEGNIANIWTIRSSLGYTGVAEAHMPREQATRLAILIQNRWRYNRVGRDNSVHRE